MYHLKLRLKQIIIIFDRNINEVKDDFVGFCRRKNFDKLELAFPELKHRVYVLILLPNVTALHCNDKALLEIIETKRGYAMNEIDKLCIYDRYRSLKSHIHEVEAHFPNLVELRLFLFENNFPLVSLFERFSKLKEIYIGMCSEMRIYQPNNRYSVQDIVEWSNTRSTLTNASKVIVYLPSDISEKLNLQIIEQGLIVVKPYMDEYCECLAATEFDYRHGVTFPEVDGALRLSSQYSESG